MKSFLKSSHINTSASTVDRIRWRRDQNAAVNIKKYRSLTQHWGLLKIITYALGSDFFHERKEV